MARSTGCLCPVPEVSGQRPPLGGFAPSGLVAEDDNDVPAYSVEVLRELGYRVLEAHDVPRPCACSSGRRGELRWVDLITEPCSYADLADKVQDVLDGA